MARNATSPLLAFCLFGLSLTVTHVLGVSFRDRGHAEFANEFLLDLNAAHDQMGGNITYETLATKVPQVREHNECLCPIGQFWHWRIRKCIDQGPWGYECGFFPAEHHHRVCLDGYTCRKTEGAKDTYVSHGLYEGTANTFPASCSKCEAADKCLKGEKRHSEECLKEYTVEGDACATVRVTLPVRAEATATVSKKASVTESAKVRGSPRVEATSERTASHTHTSTATSLATAEGSACFTLAEAKKLMGLAPDQRYSAVLASQISAIMQLKALDRAMAEARAAAEAQGLLDAEEAARMVAEAEATQRAEHKAVKAAKEAAAWKAEAGANEQAKAAAAERAESLGKEEVEATKEALKHEVAQEEAAKATEDAWLGSVQRDEEVETPTAPETKNTNVKMSDQEHREGLP